MQQWEFVERGMRSRFTEKKNLIIRKCNQTPDCDIMSHMAALMTMHISMLKNVNMTQGFFNHDPTQRIRNF
jgi:hypothetical protein